MILQKRAGCACSSQAAQNTIHGLSGATKNIFHNVLCSIQICKDVYIYIKVHIYTHVYIQRYICKRGGETSATTIECFTLVKRVHAGCDRSSTTTNTLLLWSSPKWGAATMIVARYNTDYICRMIFVASSSNRMMVQQPKLEKTIHLQPNMFMTQLQLDNGGSA